MRRFYLTQLVGSGSFLDPFTVGIKTIRGAGDRMRFWVPDAPGAGAPVLVGIEAPTQTNYLLDGNTSALPDLPLDGSLSTLNTPTRNRLSTDVTSRGLQVTWGSTASMREVLNSIGNQIAGGFDADVFASQL